LYEALEAVRGGRNHAAVNHVPQEAFAPLPYKVFGYWCSDAVREAFRFPSLLSGERVTVRQGTATADDFRFLRLRWECAEDTHPGWMPFAKGGEYNPFHDDIHLFLSWEAAWHRS
jgi:hypothetical protein